MPKRSPNHLEEALAPFSAFTPTLVQLESADAKPYQATGKRGLMNSKMCGVGEIFVGMAEISA